MFNFEKLEVWRKSVDFAHYVYRLTQAFQVHIVARQAYLSEGNFQSMHASAEELSPMLSGLKSYLAKDSNG